MNSSALLKRQKLLIILQVPYIFRQSCPKLKTLQNPCAQIQNPLRVLGVSQYSTQSTKFPDYQMPSVTWGVVQGKNEKLVNRVKICDYLKTLDIDRGGTSKRRRDEKLYTKNIDRGCTQRKVDRGEKRTTSKFQTFRWHAVASWTWDAQDETCGICRMAFDGCCSDCKLPGDDCPLRNNAVKFVAKSMKKEVWGACNHAFHLHCILKWVNSQASQAHCPMCRREWQFKG
ncbi:Anaphase-promoting complex subunit 11 [Theobroma cacao]|nr:Anaphase-promoting complex subunit 11 [Theobroma cacao]